MNLIFRLMSVHRQSVIVVANETFTPSKTINNQIKIAPFFIISFLVFDEMGGKFVTETIEIFQKTESCSHFGWLFVQIYSLSRSLFILESNEKHFIEMIITFTHILSFAYGYQFRPFPSVRTWMCVAAATKNQAHVLISVKVQDEPFNISNFN